MTILTRLPEDYHENTLAIRSSLQSVRFYVDGELRMEYDTSGTRLVGKNSASCYVFCPTSEDDAGKEVRIELTTNTAKYSGVVNTVYCGDEAAIWGVSVSDVWTGDCHCSFFVVCRNHYDHFWVFSRDCLSDEI